jgi:hypothetical protein
MSESQPPSRAIYESAVPPPDGWGREQGLAMPAWSGPTVVMAQALELVQRDLDAAGLDRYVITYAVAGGSVAEPTVNVQWRGTWTSDGITLESDDLTYTSVEVAAQAAQGLVELEDVYWPTCPRHGVRARATVERRGRAVWWCKSGTAPHVLSLIGDLDQAQRDGNHRGPLWRTLDQLPTP